MPPRRWKHPVALYRAEYAAWMMMIRRCRGIGGDRTIRFYVQKGITVCQRWIKSFDAFVDDVGRRPSGRLPGRARANYSLDRIDGMKGYKPGNVRWATKKVQIANRGCSYCGKKGHLRPLCYQALLEDMKRRGEVR